MSDVPASPAFPPALARLFGGLRLFVCVQMLDVDSTFVESFLGMALYREICSVQTEEFPESLEPLTAEEKEIHELALKFNTEMSSAFRLAILKDMISLIKKG